MAWAPQQKGGKGWNGNGAIHTPMGVVVPPRGGGIAGAMAGGWKGGGGKGWSDKGWSDKGGKDFGKGGFKGSGKDGKGKGKGKPRGPSGPGLPRERITEEPVTGEVQEWRGKYGWITPTVPIEHQLAQKHKGNIYVSMSDLVGGITELTQGSLCQFHVFQDASGLGAEECLGS
mmetsp:Transcript_59059/g.149970  ORF Transcript_59059/g.149970 Transcript_59059/m.149970 type:complete len:173 (-) Transcript_59059:129-647(-)